MRRRSGGPYFLKINMDAGHGGVSGRFASLRETALEYAFALACVGARDAPPQPVASTANSGTRSRKVDIPSRSRLMLARDGALPHGTGRSELTVGGTAFSAW